MFTPPEGPKFLPLSECPNLASTLTDRERRRIESLAETLLAQVHDGGFRVSLKPGTMKKSRKVYGDIHETYANWYIVVHRDFKPNRQDESVHDLGLDDNQTLAAALYLCEKLGASVKNVHLFKPFRPSAYVEAWLAQSEVSDVSLLRARHGAAAIALSEYRTNAIVGSEPICLFVDGVEHSVKTWRDVYITTCDIITKKDVALLRKAAASINNNYFGLRRTDKMRAPYCHEASGVWLNLYFSADGIVRYVKDFRLLRIRSG